MKSRRPRFAAFAITFYALLAFVVAPYSVQATELSDYSAPSINSSIDPVDNFERVSPGLWRGAQPSEEGLSLLAQRGVRTIIDLRMEGEGAKKESLQAKTLGMNYVHFPLGFMSPSDEKIKEILSVALNPVNQPVFIHCRQGADRTGMLVGIYRRLVMGWSFERTYSEMRRHHFKPWLFTLKKRVREVTPQQLPEVAKVG